MKNNILLLLLLFTAICEQGKAQQSSQLEEARAAIIASNNIYFQSFSKGDSSIFIERYAPDACIMPPNSPALCGTDAAAKFFREAYRLGLRNGKFTIIDIYGHGEYVTEYGLYESRDAGGRLRDEGKYLVLWKKTAQGWKMFRDSFSSNRSN